MTAGAALLRRAARARACETPECAGIRPRVDFGVKSILKAEYVIELNESCCCLGCGVCIA